MSKINVTAEKHTKGQCPFFFPILNFEDTT